MKREKDAGSEIRREEALEYHAGGRPGKIEVTPTKSLTTARDLSLAYTPGVAEPCLEIERDKNLSYSYTARGNLVAVISNGTAVLGLGDIGPHAGKPVMEGKGVLFKRFADIDVFDIEVDEHDVDAFVKIVRALEPTFGGINLEDIRAPECFEIERRLVEDMNIPVFHDDQHGTAIISGAALLNAAEMAGKSFADMRVVVSGAGASAIACTDFYVSLGVKRENVLLVDSRGVVYKGRAEGMNPYKEAYAAETERRTLAEAMEGADVFLGLSKGGLVTQDMVRSMAADPVVFALANPDPEISYPDAVEAREDVIMATGRSDYPNQVNNVLGFPFIFRGALDVRARAITEGMKQAAARALADLAREDVPENVARAYGGERFSFGRRYLIPKPFDPRVLLWVAPAVAKAAVADGVARIELDLDRYQTELKGRQSLSHSVMSSVVGRAKRQRVRIVFPEGDDLTVLRACEVLASDGICDPILLGPGDSVRALVQEHHMDALSDAAIIDPATSPDFERYVTEYYELRQRRGIWLHEARRAMVHPSVFGSMLLFDNQADGLVVGRTMSYPDAVRPALQILKTEGGRTAAGVYVVITKNAFTFFADCTINVDPSAEELADIAERTADLARYFEVEPRIAMLSYGNFGSSPGPSPDKMARATRILRSKRPDLMVDGELQADAAMDEAKRRAVFPFSTLDGVPNILIFPNLDSANIAYKLLAHIGGAEFVGPILLGMRKAVNVLHFGAEVSDIVNLAAITAIKAQKRNFKF